MLPSAPHITTSWTQVVYPIKPGERNSWRVYALQMGLLARGYDIFVDGDYDHGLKLERAVRRFQEINGLTVDGIVGVLTQRQLLRKVEMVADDENPGVPGGMLFGLMMRESSGLLAPTNDFDPSPSDIGTDCGCLQWRVAGPPYNMDALKAAFDPKASMVMAIIDEEKGMLPRFRRITKRQPSLSLETRWRAVIIAHNAPFLYEQYVDFGRILTPDKIAGWTEKPTGGSYTYKEWFNVYTSDVLEYVQEL